METVLLTPDLGLMNWIDILCVCLVYSYLFQLSKNDDACLSSLYKLSSLNGVLKSMQSYILRVENLKTIILESLQHTMQIFYNIRNYSVNERILNNRIRVVGCFGELGHYLQDTYRGDQLYSSVTENAVSFKRTRPTENNTCF